MDDRELLERAARAAGYGELKTLSDGSIIVNARRWNPLIRDGDAFRLAMHFGMIVNMASPIGETADVKFYDIVVSEPVGDGRFAATRRAIVRAAAEIGMADALPVAG